MQKETVKTTIREDIIDYLLTHKDVKSPNEIAKAKGRITKSVRHKLREMISHGVIEAKYDADTSRYISLSLPNRLEAIANSLADGSFMKSHTQMEKLDGYDSINGDTIILADPIGQDEFEQHLETSLFNETIKHRKGKSLSQYKDEQLGVIGTTERDDFEKEVQEELSLVTISENDGEKWSDDKKEKIQSYAVDKSREGKDSSAIVVRDKDQILSVHHFLDKDYADEMSGIFVFINDQIYDLKTAYKNGLVEDQEARLLLKLEPVFKSENFDPIRFENIIANTVEDNKELDTVLKGYINGDFKRLEDGKIVPAIPLKKSKSNFISKIWARLFKK